MDYMFSNCTSFKQELNTWKTDNVIFMSGMFSNCTIFNQPLSNWTTTNVTTMDSMFLNCREFDRPLNTWNTDNVTDVYAMFSNCTKFDQDLRHWKLPTLMQLIMKLTPTDRFGGIIPLTEFDTFDERRLKRLLDSISTMFLQCKIRADFLPPLIRRFKEEISEYPNMSYGSKLRRIPELYDEFYPKPVQPSVVTRTRNMLQSQGRDFINLFRRKPDVSQTVNHTQEFSDAQDTDEFHDPENIGAGRPKTKRRLSRLIR